MLPEGAPEFGVCAQAVAVPADVHDLAVVEQPVDERDGHDLVAEDLAPLFEALYTRIRPARHLRRDRRKARTLGLGSRYERATALNSIPRAIPRLPAAGKLPYPTCRGCATPLTLTALVVKDLEFFAGVLIIHLLKHQRAAHRAYGLLPSGLGQRL